MSENKLLSCELTVEITAFLLGGKLCIEIINKSNANDFSSVTRTRPAFPGEEQIRETLAEAMEYFMFTQGFGCELAMVIKAEMERKINETAAKDNGDSGMD